MDAYHEVNRAVHRAESGVEPVDDFTETKMRKERMALKDEIAGHAGQGLRPDGSGPCPDPVRAA